MLRANLLLPRANLLCSSRYLLLPRANLLCSSRYLLRNQLLRSTGMLRA